MEFALSLFVEDIEELFSFYALAFTLRLLFGMTKE